MTLDFSRCPLPPFAHQQVGVEALLQHPFFFLADEMGAAKSAQVIIAAQFLYEREIIDKVLVLCPGSVRSVWYDRDFGELRKHLWPTTSAQIIEFHATVHDWTSGPASPHPLKIVVSNYEFIRGVRRYQQLAPYCDKRTLLVCDESSAVKSHTSQQFKATMLLRKRCGRIVLLSGTPIANNPIDLFAQGNLLSPHVLDCPYITYFKAKYAIMAPIIGRNGKALLSPHGRALTHISGWQQIPELQRRFAPYVLRRLKQDCLDLPPKLPPVTLTATLKETWPHYKAMRDEMVVKLASDNYSIAQQAVTKLIRLSQITSGFLGGVEELHLDGQRTNYADPYVVEIGREKLEVLLEWLTARLEEDPNFKVVVGCRFVPELNRAAFAIGKQFPQMAVGVIVGEQGNASREQNLRLLDPRTAPHGPVVVLMTKAGSLGINLTAAHTLIRLSRDFSLFQSLQSEDRLHRIGQTHAVSYYDILAEGPRGQSTIDRVILRAVQEKQNVAEWTASAWLSALTQEET